jgi:hypothetical protein
MPDLAFLDAALERLRATYLRLADGLTSHSQGGVSATRERMQAVRLEIQELERQRAAQAQAQSGDPAAGWGSVQVVRA